MALNNQTAVLRELVKILSVESSHSPSLSLVQATEQREQAAVDAGLVVKSAAARARAIRYNGSRISPVFLLSFNI